MDAPRLPTRERRGCVGFCHLRQTVTGPIGRASIYDFHRIGGRAGVIRIGPHRVFVIARWRRRESLIDQRCVASAPVSGRLWRGVYRSTRLHSFRRRPVSLRLRPPRSLVPWFGPGCFHGADGTRAPSILDWREITMCRVGEIMQTTSRRRQKEVCGDFVSRPSSSLASLRTQRNCCCGSMVAFEGGLSE